MGVNYQIGADASSFKQGVSEAQASLKTLDAALKNNEASFKAGGNAQIFMEQKTQLLNDKMAKQKQLVTQLQQGLQKMREAGVAPTSVEYQKLETQMLNAQAAMNETKVAIDNLDGSQLKAAGSAGELTSKINSIGKKISLEQVLSGINSITSAMGTATSAAVKLGEAVWDNVMNSAKWADDTATMALMYGIDVEKLQQMQKLVSDTSWDAILTSQQRLNKNIGEGNKNALTYIKDLGVAIASVTGESMDIVQRKDPADLFWEIGDALMHMSDAYDKEAAAQAIFGRAWKDLIPLFNEFDSREEYENALKNVNVNTEEEVNDLALLNDKVTELQNNIQTLTNKGWAALAPSLTGAADALNGLLGNVLEYLDTPEGKDALKQMGESVSTLFEDLGKIDPEDVVENFVSVFGKLKDGFVWIADHWGDVRTGLLGIAGAFGLMKVSEGVLTALKIISGFKGLGGGGNDTAREAAEVVVASGGGGIVRKGIRAGSKLAQKLYAADPSGTTALIAPYLEDHTRFGQTLRDGGTLKEAAENSMDEVKKYFTETLPKNWENFWETSYWGEIIGGYKDAFQQTIQNYDKYMDQYSASESSGVFKDALDDLQKYFEGNGKEVDVKVDPEPPVTAPADISKEIGTVPVAVQPVFSGAGYGGSTGGGSFDLLRDIGNGFRGLFGHHANGLWSVPFDNYPALLHAGERVVPAREVSSHNYNSNLYVERMIMNNGADAQGLADAMAAANRRRMSGYGS